MTNSAPSSVVNWFILLVLLLFSGKIYPQDCSDPALICALLSTDTLSLSEGLPVGVPNGFCVDEAPNALFFSFQTLDTDQFPDLVYNDSTAVLQFQVDSCNTDTLYSTGFNISIFEASDPCDGTTYGDPLACALDLEDSGQIPMEGLMPSTTYHVMVTSILENFPDAFPTDCAMRLSVAGPAVEYDIAADPETPQNQTIIPGESVLLEVNPIFEPYDWTGEALSSTSGSAVEASPTEFGVYTYQAETEINGCPVQETFLVTVIPPITPYNAFTPNSDGFNDTWEIDRIQEWPNAQIVVYSRWGTKVFQATNYSNTWDGDDLPAATYYYVIELNPIEFNTDPITGSVTIVR